MLSLNELLTEMVPDVDTKRGLRRCWQLHRFRPGADDGQISLSRLLNRRQPNLGTEWHALCIYNAYLMRASLPILDYLLPKPDAGIFGHVPVIGDIVQGFLDLPSDAVKGVIAAAGWEGGIQLENKPEIEARAKELGQRLAKGAGGDLIALCEVWLPEFRQLILNKMTTAGLNVKMVTGTEANPNPPEFAMLGDGLCVFGINLPVKRVAKHIFTNKGAMLADADAWARKGVMLTEVTVGPGRIDLYSTHLHSGGDLTEDGKPVKVLGQTIVHVPSEEEKRAVRAAQVREIVNFIKQTHDPSHVALLGGDFNINGAADEQPYWDLRDRMNELGFVDRWREVYGPAIPGFTNGDLANVCDGVGVCNEATVPSGGGERIDYLFIEQPTTSHLFNLDLTVLKRHAFKRPPGSGSEVYLSDHLGLGTGLICNPLSSHDT